MTPEQCGIKQKAGSHYERLCKRTLLSIVAETHNRNRGSLSKDTSGQIHYN